MTPLLLENVGWLSCYPTLSLLACEQCLLSWKRYEILLLRSKAMVRMTSQCSDRFSSAIVSAGQKRKTVIVMCTTSFEIHVSKHSEYGNSASLMVLLLNWWSRLRISKLLMLILGYTYATLPMNNLINQLFDEVVYFKSYYNQLLSIL